MLRTYTTPKKLVLNICWRQISFMYFLGSTNYLDMHHHRPWLAFNPLQQDGLMVPR